MANEGAPQPAGVSGQRPARSYGYFEATRSKDALWLIEHYPKAYLLAAVVAHRARWSNDGFNPHGLLFGEAFLGDHDRYGRMTEGDYRGAKRVLAKMHFATFRRTNRGTVARLVDSRLFKINPPKANGQGNGQQTGDVTTNVKSIEPESDKPLHNVNLVNQSPETPLTKLTVTAASMKRIARDIAGDKRGWFWDNCKVMPADISAASLETVLQPYADRLTVKAIHEAWQEAVTRAHGATVDRLKNAVKSPSGYCVTCFKEQLENAVKRTSAT